MSSVDKIRKEQIIARACDSCRRSSSSRLKTRMMDPSKSSVRSITCSVATAVSVSFAGDREKRAYQTTPSGHGRPGKTNRMPDRLTSLKFAPLLQANVASIIEAVKELTYSSVSIVTFASSETPATCLQGAATGNRTRKTVQIK